MPIDDEDPRVAVKPRKGKPVPYDFVLEILAPLRPRTHPMFGCLAVYVEDKIMLVLRRREDWRQDNGVWLATTREQHKSLKRELPSMRSISMFGGGVTGWQVLPEEAPDFERSVRRACELILARDNRIGRIPKAKSRGTRPR